MNRKLKIQTKNLNHSIETYLEIIMQPIKIIGGGMAGCEAAWQLVNRGIPVIIYEMRPKKDTFAHKTEDLAELVCSNSFRSNDHENNAVGLLHWEMKEADSLIINTGNKHSVPAGWFLAGSQIAVQPLTSSLRRNDGGA